MRTPFRHFLSLFIVAFVVTSCAFVDKQKSPARLTASSFDSLENWENDAHHKALAAFAISCEESLLKKEPTAHIGPMAEDGWPVGGTASEWREPCQSAVLMMDAAQKPGPEQARAFFEEWFRPWKVSAGPRSEGLFTGYYEPQLYGSRTRQRAYQTPLLARPDDLVMADLGHFRDDLSGRRIAGRVIDGRLYPYEDRAEIDKGLLPPESFDPIVWIDDPIDAFFLHIQGSGQVVLEDGSVTRVGYAGQNGHPYYAIGRELVKRDIMDKDEVSMQSIAHYLRTHPDQMEEILHTNPSYIFFRELEKGPLGAQGVVLTPERSLAIDYTKLPYGAPVWVDTQAPIEEMERLQRLMVTQDTGGAIRGAVRGDVYWGAGARAEEIAGRMKSQGRKWILLPRTIQ